MSSKACDTNIFRVYPVTCFRTDKVAVEFAPNTRTPYGVFIRNIVYDATPEHLKALFEQYGKVNFSQIALDGGQMSKG